MSFLNKLGKMFAADTELTPRVALGLACLSMIAADGIIEEEEIGVLASVHVLDGDTLNQAIRRFRQFGGVAGDCVAPVAEALNIEQQQTCLAILFDIAMADGRLAGDEKRLLEQYIDHFSVETAALETIGEVIALKNRPVFPR
ncbi:MAG TPA: hypothetical protein DCE42_23670 [Myxococcales bacterium]|nr:hypothetical protein [Deltaproteobacteria bacterium]MBU52415.1 hypothetical protein [Deltaproteobacteria bacterium]HAA57786.1 hypothetical protein [Myxococcales bacterium]|tara:strand:+ start:2377 stop:2805 length:429 start_codon:yes stop_codon:yes gene_type:complete